MAFDRKKLGGNVTASAQHSTMFLYKSETDTLAEIATAEYFVLANGDPVRGVGSIRGSEQIIFKDDLMLVQGVDGFAIGSVNANAKDITLEATEV